jgi:hypothetical protein
MSDYSRLLLLHFSFILLIFCASTNSGYAQPADRFVFSEMVPEVLVTQAYEVHRELIHGDSDSILKLFMLDTIWGKENTQYIREARNDVRFTHHSARIDTSRHVGNHNSPKDMAAYISFRDIFYLGDNKFRSYKITVCYYGAWKSTNVTRQITIYSGIVNSREIWSRYSWGTN